MSTNVNWEVILDGSWEIPRPDIDLLYRVEHTPNFGPELDHINNDPDQDSVYDPDRDIRAWVHIRAFDHVTPAHETEQNQARDHDPDRDRGVSVLAGG